MTGATGWLTDVGITDRLDGIIADAGKPARMAAHLTALLDQAGASGQPGYLASVGDVWINDIGPALDIGARGFHIDRFGLGRGPSTAQARSIEELYPALREWVRNP